jgi:hypothetical protein
MATTMAQIVAMAKERRSVLLSELRQLDTVIGMGAGRAKSEHGRRRGVWERTPETRARHSEAMKAAWAKRKANGAAGQPVVESPNVEHIQ